MYVGHAVAVLAREPHRIRPPDQQMPGVQAPADIDHVERALHLRGRLDQRAHVRVQRNPHAVLVRGQRLDRVEVLRQLRPPHVIQRLRRAPVRVLNRRQHEHPAPAPLINAAARARLLDRLVRGWLVQHERDEPADQLQARSGAGSPSAPSDPRAGTPGDPARSRGCRAPTSLAARPRARASRPSPGTSHAPHEMGPPASLSAMARAPRTVRARRRLHAVVVPLLGG